MNEIQELDLNQIAEDYDTPVFIYEKNKIVSQYQRLEKAFSDQMDNFSIHYAVKANFNPSIVRTLVDQGAGMDCAAGPELELARELEIDFDHVIYTAPYNRKEEIERASELGATVNLDGEYLLDKLDEAPENVCVRIDPGIGRGEGGLVFAGGDSQFGVHQEQAIETFRRAREMGAEKFGIHMMTGSNVRDEEYFGEITARLLEIADNIAQELGVEFEFVDIGGGLGVPYHPSEEHLDVEKVAENVSREFQEGVENFDIGDPELRMEPGRFMVAEAGYLLTKVTGVKEKGDRRFVGVDTGMHHIIRPMLLDAYHPIKTLEDREEMVQTVVGPVCSSTDIIAEKRMMPEMLQGDLVLLENAGAYGFSMASHWNTRPLPAELMVTENGVELIREAENWQDVFHGTFLE